MTHLFGDGALASPILLAQAEEANDETAEITAQPEPAPRRWTNFTFDGIIVGILIGLVLFAVCRATQRR